MLHYTGRDGYMSDLRKRREEEEEEEAGSGNLGCYFRAQNRDKVGSLPTLMTSKFRPPSQIQCD